MSGILHHLGVFMGKSFIEADAGNIWGYWEDAEFHKICMSVWDTLQHSFVSEKDKKGLTEWREKLMRLAGERRTLNRPWGFKNPRMANAPEFFFSCFDKPIIIRCKRNDEDAIRSFVRAYSTELDEEKARYWYNFRKRNLDEALKNREHLEIRFEDLISKKEETVRRIADYVGLPVKQEAVDFIKSEKELVSIIVPCVNRCDLTRVCLDSVIKYTEEKYELIIVQEGEDEELNKLLRAYNVKFVHNRKPKGFAGAMNSGAKEAQGNILVFLNNDTVVIPNWLTHILEVFEKDKKIGLVSPTYTEAKKRPQNVDANDGEEITYIKNPLELKGVCFAVRREAFEQVGGWDESYGLGGGEDNELCTQLVKNNWRLAVARRSYIYHYGSATFRELFNNDIDYSKKYAVRQFNKFRRKHMPNEKPSVFISVPCYDGKINHELSLRLIQWSHDPNFTCTIKFYPYLAPLDNARNLAVKELLENYHQFFFHCFKGRTLIETKDGAKNIRDIQVGEFVKTHKNRFRKVKKVYERRLTKGKDIIWLKTNNCLTKVTPEHPYLILRNGKEEWKKVKDLYLTDKLLYPINNKTDYLKFDCFGHKSNKNGNGREGKRSIQYFGNYLVDEDLARFMGLYLAEGNSDNTGIRFTFNNNETEYHNFVEKVCLDKFGRKVGMYSNWATSVALHIKSFGDLFKKWFGKNAREKRIPEFVFRWNLRNRLAFIRGYVEGDGNIHKKGASVRSASKLLIEDFKRLCSQSGIATGKIFIYDIKEVEYKGNKIKGTTIYVTQMNKYEWGKIMDILEGKIYNNKYTLIPIKNIELRQQTLSGKKEDTNVYNLEVEEDNTYIANSAIVHNCDNDIVPPENCITELLKADKDVIAPLCFTIKHDDDNIPFTIPVAMRYDENRQYRPYYGRGIEEVDAMTGGCFLVKREVFEKLERPFAFTYHKNGIVEYSEDFYFSQQVKEKLGLKLWTHFGLHCKHIREVDCSGINRLCIKIQSEKK